MSYFKFRQNNSFGHFVGTPLIFVQADNAADANAIAQQNGIYFNGVADGVDCDCCGDRWYRPESPITREEVDELIEVRTGPDAIKWDEWPSQEAEFKIVEKED